ncbi:hypothetical protein GEMRC1_008186 [Eukaryota sp. GEM-RC1]
MLSDFSISLKYSNFTLLESGFHNVAGSFIYGLNSKVLLQDVTVSGLPKYHGPGPNNKFNDENFDLIDLYSSTFIAINVKVNEVVCQYLLHSSNSTLSLEANTFTDSVLNSAIHCINTILQSDDLIFDNLTILHNCVTFWIPVAIYTPVLNSSLSVSNLSVTNFDSLVIFNIIDHSVVKIQDTSVLNCKSGSLEPDGEPYVTIIDSQTLLDNFKFSGCTSQSVFKSDFNVTNSSLTLTNSSEFLLLSSLSVQNSSLLFSSGYPIISKFVTIDQASEILGTDSVLDLSELFFNISISPTQHCCNTSFVMFHLYLMTFIILKNC